VSDTEEEDAMMMPALAAAAVNLNHPAHYIHWGWFQISVANFVVIVLMLIVFVLAILLPFPAGRRS
jgi:hypothetical protein